MAAWQVRGTTSHHQSSSIGDGAAVVGLCVVVGGVMLFSSFLSFCFGTVGIVSFLLGLGLLLGSFVGATLSVIAIDYLIWTPRDPVRRLLLPRYNILDAGPGGGGRIVGALGLLLFLLVCALAAWARENPTGAAILGGVSGLCLLVGVLYYRGRARLLRQPRQRLAERLAEVQRRWPEFAAAFAQEQGSHFYVVAVRRGTPKPARLTLRVTGIEQNTLTGYAVQAGSPLDDSEQGELLEIDQADVVDWIYYHARGFTGGLGPSMLDFHARQWQQALDPPRRPFGMPRSW